MQKKMQKKIQKQTNTECLKLSIPKTLDCLRSFQTFTLHRKLDCKIPLQTLHFQLSENRC